MHESGVQFQSHDSICFARQRWHYHFREGLVKPTESIHKLETYATAVGSGRGGTPRAESSMKPVSIPKSCSNNLELMRLDS